MKYFLIQQETKEWVEVQREVLAAYLEPLDAQLEERYPADCAYITPTGIVFSVCKAFEYTNYDI